MKLFVKKDCKKCDWVKANCSLKSVLLLDVETPIGMSELAYHSLVTVAEKNLPILVNNGEYTTSIVDIGHILGSREVYVEDCVGEECKL